MGQPVTHAPIWLPKIPSQGCRNYPAHRSEPFTDSESKPRPQPTFGEGGGWFLIGDDTFSCQQVTRSLAHSVMCVCMQSSSCEWMIVRRSGGQRLLERKAAAGSPSSLICSVALIRDPSPKFVRKHWVFRIHTSRQAGLCV
jgi:hypothetical protein